MKYALSAICLAVILIIFTSGCIGTQTTDIVIGNESVGKIYVTPNTDKLFTNSSITEKFDMKVQIFGFEFSKNGITRTEANSIIDLLSSGIEGTDTLTNLGFNMVSSSKPDDFDEIINQIVNMPISAKDSTKVTDAISSGKIWAGFPDAAQKIMKLFGIS